MSVSTEGIAERHTKGWHTKRMSALTLAGCLHPCNELQLAARPSLPPPTLTGFGLRSLVCREQQQEGKKDTAGITACSTRVLGVLE